MKNTITLEEIINILGEIPLCQCGCGHKINIEPKRYRVYQHKGYPKYIKGHQGKYIRTEEYKLKQSQILLNKKQSSWNKGLTKYSDERVNLISEKLKNRKISSKTIESIKIANRLKLSDGSWYPSIPDLCHCGCGEIVYNGHKFIIGHHIKGIKKSEEFKNKMSERMLSDKNHFRGKKLSQQHINNLKKSHKGLNTWNKERIWNEESRNKLSKSLKGKNIWAKGRKHTPEEIEKQKLNRPDQHGKNHWNWKGGITSLKRQIRQCDKYIEWRTQIFIRDNRVCKECESNDKIEAHHIKPISVIIKDNNIQTIEHAINCSELWDLNNGMTLCLECHKKTDSYKRNQITKDGRVSDLEPTPST